MKKNEAGLMLRKFRASEARMVERIDENRARFVAPRKRNYQETLPLGIPKIPWGVCNGRLMMPPYEELFFEDAKRILSGKVMKAGA